MLYTFYMCNRDGSSNSLEAFHLSSDAVAAETAVKMLEQHQSCAYVSAFEADRPVLVRYRGVAAS